MFIYHFFGHLNLPCFLASYDIFCVPFVPNFCKYCFEFTCSKIQFTLSYTTYLHISLCLIRHALFLFPLQSGHVNENWNFDHLFAGNHTLSYRVPVLRDMHYLKLWLSQTPVTLVIRAWYKTNFTIFWTTESPLPQGWIGMSVGICQEIITAGMCVYQEYIRERELSSWHLYLWKWNKEWINSLRVWKVVHLGTWDHSVPCLGL